MKVCEVCSREISTKDGESMCAKCDNEIMSMASASDVAAFKKKKARNAKRNASRRAREAALRSCGLVKVRGALGGIYWE